MTAHRNRRRATVLFAIASAFSVSACNSEPEETAAPAQNGANEAAGEVLGGEISDAMIQLETLRSEAPPRAAEPAVEDDADEEVDNPATEESEDESE